MCSFNEGECVNAIFCRSDRYVEKLSKTSTEITCNNTTTTTRRFPEPWRNNTMKKKPLCV